LSECAWQSILSAALGVLATGFGGAPGDSGGPVFLSESAYGTISCVNSTTVIYGAVDWLEGGLGVTILTTP
jgi:hypothetical protein